ncbi:hypothetical protein V4D07_11485 [Paenibacillus taichungensis]
MIQRMAGSIPPSAWIQIVRAADRIFAVCCSSFLLHFSLNFTSFDSVQQVM